MQDLSRPILSREIESVVKQLPMKKTLDLMILMVNTIKHLKKNLYWSFSNFSKNLKRWEVFQTHSIRSTLPYHQSQKTLQEKKSTDQYCLWTLIQNMHQNTINRIQQDFTSWPSETYSWNARVTQYVKNDQWNLPYHLNERE